MLVIISPSKTLDFDTPTTYGPHTQPDFLAESQTLINGLKKLTPGQIEEFMGISSKLAELNFKRFQEWSLPFTPDNAKQAILAFKGDVFTGLKAEDFTDKDFQSAQHYLRILSGLYGVLRPLDLIQPYRLEMGKKWETIRGKDLYQFWGDKITSILNKEIEKSNTRYLINLASNEYFKSVNKKTLKAKVITPVFKDLKQDKYKVISFYAKKARGLMSRFIIRNRIDDPQHIKAFCEGGYIFNPNLTTGHQWVFTRDH